MYMLNNCDSIVVDTQLQTLLSYWPVQLNHSESTKQVMLLTSDLCCQISMMNQSGMYRVPCIECFIHGG